jgi:hypothetical protein
MPAPIKLLALRPGSTGAGWQEWQVDFALVGLAGPAGEPVVVTVAPRAPLDRPDRALAEAWVLLARLATRLAFATEAQVRGARLLGGAPEAARPEGDGDLVRLAERGKNPRQHFSCCWPGSDAASARAAGDGDGWSAACLRARASGSPWLVSAWGHRKAAGNVMSPRGYRGFRAKPCRSTPDPGPP